jgi:hypothetical protein
MVSYSFAANAREARDFDTRLHFEQAQGDLRLLLRGPRRAQRSLDERVEFGGVFDRPRRQQRGELGGAKRNFR